ncbi:hypothetical protein GGF46_001150 [Coemansia sp. RSA 552]|nr:hypothetical protein GGF46_001150 [Coemansia sp. RSA 552]
MFVENTQTSFPVRAVVVMGVSGCGKTAVGSRLARRMGGAPFIDADDLHSPQNVDKMARGLALLDSDRWPWLERVRERISAEAAKLLEGQHASQKTPQPRYVVCACSSLKRSYREFLSRSSDPRLPAEQWSHDTVFVYVSVDRQELARRLGQRKNHFFDPSLLDSQLATLEAPDIAREAAVTVDGNAPLAEVVASAYAQIEGLTLLNSQ